MEDKIEQIKSALENKACLKQQIFRNTLKVFEQLKQSAFRLQEELSSHFAGVDETVKIEYREINEFEFRLKFGGDMLIFTMHSNVVTFPKEHLLAKNTWIQEDKNRAFFGQFMVYNFMADSIKYNRLTDPGYLVMRMLLNKDNHFFLEGNRHMSILFPEIEKNVVSDDFLRFFIEQAMLTSVENDLIVPPLQAIHVVQLGKKVANQMVSGGTKVGFQMSFMKK